MKKFFSVVLAAAMLLALGALAGCGQTKQETTTDTNNQSGASYTTVQEGTLTMGTNAQFPPYEFYDGEKIVGIDAEIAQAIADKLGLKLDIVDMDFGSIVTSVQTGKLDIGMAGMTVNEERKQNVDFTDSYATGVQSIIVKENSKITSLDDLNAMAKNGEEFLIGTQEATTGFLYASDTIEKGGFGEDHVIAYTNGATAVQALMDGKVDCVIIDNQPAKEYVKANAGLTVLDTAYVTEDYAIAVSKDNTALRDAVNKALKELIADGTVQKVLDKYISTDTAANTDKSDTGEAPAENTGDTPTVKPATGESDAAQE